LRSENNLEIMKKILFLAILVLANLCRAADGGELLYWMIMPNDSFTVKNDDGSVYANGTAAQLGVTGARIRCETSEGTVGYLPIIGIYPGGNNITFEGASGSPIPGGYHAALGSYTGAAYSYVLELGNWSNGTWAGTKMEATATYDYLKEQQHIAQWEDMPPSYVKPWTPTEFTVVPEPTGGLLILVGGALLALRRSRQKVV
jgi:hypothetical protein